MGLRNIDMFLKGNGTIGLENGSLNIGLKDMLLALSTEIAAGYLPELNIKLVRQPGLVLRQSITLPKIMMSYLV